MSVTSIMRPGFRHELGYCYPVEAERAGALIDTWPAEITRYTNATRKWSTQTQAYKLDVTLHMDAMLYGAIVRCAWRAKLAIALTVDPPTATLYTDAAHRVADALRAGRLSSQGLRLVRASGAGAYNAFVDEACGNP